MEIFLYIVVIIGTIISLMNFYLSFLVMYVEKNKVGSGVPFIGSFILLITLFFIQENILFYMVLFFILLDTGGIHWTIVYTLYRSLTRKENL